MNQFPDAACPLCKAKVGHSCTDTYGSQRPIPHHERPPAYSPQKAEPAMQKGLGTELGTA